jgi:tetratricopeptide (TPR) repeat protein
MSFIGYYISKSKFLLLVVSFWHSPVYATETNAVGPVINLVEEAEALQKTQNGDQKAINFLWKHSEKLKRTELLFLAKLLVKKRSFKEILKASELALAQNPKDAEFLTFQGKSYVEIAKDKKTMDKAQESLRAAIEANPLFEPAYLILDDFYERQDDLIKKQKKPMRYLQTRRLIYEDLSQKIGEKQLYQAKLCEINMLDGVNEQALKQCRRAVEMKKEDSASFLNLAQVLRQSGDKKAATETLLTALKGNPKSIEILTALGNQMEDDKNYGAAYGYFKDCLQVSSNTDVCIRGLGASAVSLKKWQEGFDSFQKLCRKDRKWALDVRKASMTAKELSAPDWAQKFLELSLNCNI